MLPDHLCTYVRTFLDKRYNIFFLITGIDIANRFKSFYFINQIFFDMNGYPYGVHTGCRKMQKYVTGDPPDFRCGSFIAKRHG